MSKFLNIKSLLLAIVVITIGVLLTFTYFEVMKLADNEILENDPESVNSLIEMNDEDLLNIIIEDEITDELESFEDGFLLDELDDLIEDDIEDYQIPLD